MLQTLVIKNLAIIDELEVRFSSGFNVLTGETGAGKTILVQAISLLIGGRARSGMVRTGCDCAVISASFTVSDAAAAKKKMLDLGISADDVVTIKREIQDDGRGRAFINGEPATISMMKNIGIELINISSQHEHQLLLDSARHVSILDEGRVDRAVIEEYISAHDHHDDLKKKISNLKKEEAELKEMFEFMRYQHDELQKAALKPGEDDELAAKKEKLKHAVDLAKISQEADDLLYSRPDSVVPSLEKAASSFERLEHVEGTFKAWKERIRSSALDLKDVARELQRYAGTIGSDPKMLENIEDRLHLIRTLKRKYSCTIEGCMDKRLELSSKLEKVKNFDNEILKIESELDAAAKSLEAAGLKLRQQRRKAAVLLKNSIEDELGDLEMKKAGFLVNFEMRQRDEWDQTGPDEVKFYLSPNPGEEARPLNDIASGGELSRIMLALKCVVGKSSEMGACYVFDEVDSGIGGAVADMVGKKLVEVASSKQVICITHLPQIAACADQHFRVAKKVSGGRTVTSIERLDEEARVEELTMMLGGKRSTKALKEHARELLK